MKWDKIGDHENDSCIMDHGSWIMDHENKETKGLKRQVYKHIVN